MKRRWTRSFLLGLTLLAPAPLLERLSGQRVGALAALAVDYPEEGSIFPPEITAPTFLWRDAAPSAANWEITVSFGDGAPEIHAASAGERLRIGEIDPNQIRKSSPAYLLASKKDEAHRFSTLLSNKRKHELNTGPPVPTCPALWLAARQ